MAADFALLALSVQDLRAPIETMLDRNGYARDWLLTSSELERCLERSDVTASATLLLVVEVMMAKSCARAIERNARQRLLHRLAPLAVVLVYDPGTLSVVPQPILAETVVLAIVEAPVSVTDVRAFAVESRHLSRRFGACFGA